MEVVMKVTLYDRADDHQEIPHEAVMGILDDQCSGIMRPEQVYSAGCKPFRKWTCDTCGKSITEKMLKVISREQEAEYDARFFFDGHDRIYNSSLEVAHCLAGAILDRW
jgi:hypothetical protein